MIPLRLTPGTNSTNDSLHKKSESMYSVTPTQTFSFTIRDP
jgi:hypothetical protein